MRMASQMMMDQRTRRRGGGGMATTTTAESEDINSITTPSLGDEREVKVMQQAPHTTSLNQQRPQAPKSAPLAHRPYYDSHDRSSSHSRTQQQHHDDTVARRSPPQRLHQQCGLRRMVRRSVSVTLPVTGLFFIALTMSIGSIYWWTTLFSESIEFQLRQHQRLQQRLATTMVQQQQNKPSPSQQLSKEMIELTMKRDNEKQKRTTSSTTGSSAADRKKWFGTIKFYAGRNTNSRRVRAKKASMGQLQQQKEDGEQKEKQPMTLEDLPPSCRAHDRSRVAQILLRAGQKQWTSRLCNDLPSWREVTVLYGPKPIIHGLESCQRYRSLLATDAAANKTTTGTATAIEPMIRVAGLYNTGTNALISALNMNLKNLKLNQKVKEEYTVPWGKHVPAHRKWTNTHPPDNKELKRHVLPVVIVRDPYRWMLSMCKHSYDAKWLRVHPGHCPNLVPNQLLDEPRLREGNNGTWNMGTYPVMVSPAQTAKKTHDWYESLADFWSSWNGFYFDAKPADDDYPRLMIRFEDLLFHQEEVFDTILQCAGLPTMNETGREYRYKMQRAKSHGQSTNFMTAITAYGKETGRYDGMTQDDIDYAEKALDRQMTQLFHYPPVPLTYDPPDISTLIAMFEGTNMTTAAAAPKVQTALPTKILSNNSQTPNKFGLYSDLVKKRDDTVAKLRGESRFVGKTT